MTRLAATTVLAAAVAIAGGPDEGGYRYADSDTANGPGFEWIDITGIGTRINLGDDDNEGPFPTGATCDFYGQDYASLRVCSNGWLSFLSESHQFHHFPIPDERDPNALLAPLWADLDPSAGGDVYVWSSDTFGTVLSWHDVPFHGTEDSCTFQVVLRKDSSYIFNYLDLPDSPLLDSCSVGIENEDGTIGLQYLHDGMPEHNRLHDSLSVCFHRLAHDAALTGMLRPFERELDGLTVTPAVAVTNYGIDGCMFMLWFGAGPTYRDSVMVALASLQSEVVSLSSMLLPSECTLDVVAWRPPDQDPSNDTLRRTVVVSRVGNLRHDDGTVDTSFLRVGAPSREWGAAVRLPALPYDYHLTAARIFVLDTLPFARVAICPGDSEPDLDHPYLEAESVASPLPDTWLAVPADTMVAPGTPLWVVAFWTEQATGPRIGDDRSFPDGCSRFGSPSLYWIRHDAGDLMMRLEVNGGTGIAELAQRGLRPRLLASPNPFTASVLVSSPGPGTGARSGRVFDSRGRVVRKFSISAGEWSWRGTDGDGRLLPAGAYFVEVDSEAGPLRTKVLLTR